MPGEDAHISASITAQLAARHFSTETEWRKPHLTLENPTIENPAINVGSSAGNREETAPSALMAPNVQ